MKSKNIGLEQLALDVAKRWQRIWDEGPVDSDDVEESIHARLNEAIKARVIEVALAASHDKIDSIADKIVSKWMQSDELLLDEPSDEVTQMVSTVLTRVAKSLDDAHVYSAATRKKAEIFRLSNSGLSEKDISESLKIKPSSIRSVLKSAKRDAEKAKNHYLMFFAE